MATWIRIGIIYFLLASPSFGSTFDVVVKGKKCEVESSQQITCEFQVGKDLRFAIAGIGQEDASIVFLKSDFNGDYYASFGLMHKCVIVQQKGYLDLAFVSVRTGKVFKDWRECQGR